MAISFNFFIGVRLEFKKYLEEKYPTKTFDIGLPKINLIYSRFYASVTCLNDGTIFPISRSINNNNLSDEYMQYKSRNQYNSKIKSVFRGSDIRSYIKDVTGGGEMPYETGGRYNIVSIHLVEE